MNCFLCGAKNNRFIFNHRGKDIYLDKLGADNFRLRWFRCFNCGVYFSKQHKDIERVYDDKNLYDGQYDEKGIGLRFKKIMSLKESESDNALRVKRIKDFHDRYITAFRQAKKVFKILDVGAGTGVFLAKFLDRKYAGTAVEVNKIAANHIQNTLKIRVYIDLVQNLKTAQRFDLITMNKVIEHIKRPVPVLKAIKKMLADKGIIYVELPDVLNYEFCGNASDAFASGHYMVYNPGSMFYLLDRSGFDILSMGRILEPSGKRTIYSFARRRR